MSVCKCLDVSAPIRTRRRLIRLLYLYDKADNIVIISFVRCTQFCILMYLMRHRNARRLVSTTFPVRITSSVHTEKINLAECQVRQDVESRLKPLKASSPLLSGHEQRPAPPYTARFVAYEACHRQRFVSPSSFFGSRVVISYFGPR